MPQPDSIQATLIKEALAETPDIPARRLARELCEKYPYWKDVETCRGQIRRAIGQSGSHNLKETADKRFVRESRKPGETIETRWTPEQDKRLISLRAANEPWTSVAKDLGKRSDECRRRWKTLYPDYDPVEPAPAYIEGDCIVLTSRPDNTFVFGVAGDKHIGSKYHREDVLADLYTRFERAGVDAIFDTGNWIDGDARFNRHDLVVQGMDNQINLMAKTHPKINGVRTYAVWGDDHEGWYAQREGIDVGAYAEMRMTEAGHLWTNLGYMESHVILRNANSGQEARIAIMHPGGGTAYALSYRPQKIVESMEGGEKPAAVIMGHYHKMECLNLRNIWCLQSGCCEDQTPFMRKKSIEAHVGGVLLNIEQDPATGALVAFGNSLIRYFNRGFYNGRWSLSGSISRPARKAR